LITYQVKFRSGRPTLTWDDLGNFYGLSRWADDTLLFTNCEDFVDEVKDQSSITISGRYLDELKPEILQRALAPSMIKESSKLAITADPHQERAIADSVQHFEGNDRGQYISACGTGKTFTSFWIAEALRAKTVLYLVPSLALVKQTIGEWLRVSEAPFPFLSVCSDIKTARKGSTDELVITQSDLPFAVTTQPEQVNDWVKATQTFDFRVVFATYDSAKAVAAGVGDEFCFDLGFFGRAADGRASCGQLSRRHSQFCRRPGEL
jgi:predicted helicase